MKGNGLQWSSFAHWPGLRPKLQQPWIEVHSRRWVRHGTVESGPLTRHPSNPKLSLHPWPQKPAYSSDDEPPADDSCIGTPCWEPLLHRLTDSAGVNHHQGWGETGRTLFHDDDAAAAGNLTLEKGSHNLGPTSRRETNSPLHLLTIRMPPEAERVADSYRCLLFRLPNRLSLL